MHRVHLPELRGLVLGSSEYQTVVNHPAFAWGLHTDVEREVGPLNCTVADNFVDAMMDATDRLSDYYSGPFRDYVLPNFIGYMRDQPLPLQPPNASMPSIGLPTRQGLKDALLYSFRTCEYEDLKCDPSAALLRVERLTESLWYVLYALLGMCMLSVLTGFSLFAFAPALPLIVLAHTWNYRLTCTPNIPDCALDDVLRWLNQYKPGSWGETFPLVSADPTCPANRLWASAYFLARTPVRYPLEFVLYLNDDWYRTFGEWIEVTDRHAECLILRSADLVFTPAMLYGVYTMWGVMMWFVHSLMRVVSLVIPMLSTVYSIEKLD
jgi:hypothetical protein